MKNKKILIVRFSSIGDIVLTTPVIRCIKQQSELTEIHYLTKKSYRELLQQNPYLDKIICIEKSISEVISELKSENYDHIVDLHHNLRTFLLKLSLRKPFTSFQKLNIRKWLYVNFKINLLQHSSIVERYMETVSAFGIKYDGKGLDFFLDEKVEQNINEKFRLENNFIAFVIGSKFATKALPEEKIISICKQINLQVVLIGGKEDLEKAKRIADQSEGKCINLCGSLSFNESAIIVSKSSLVIANDTGFMHITAALNKPLISVWGSTTPELGFKPIFPDNKKQLSHIVEAENISCRPCSKLGYNKCPKGHFNCMQSISEAKIVRLVTAIIESKTT